MLISDRRVILVFAIMGRTPEYVKLRIVSLSSKSKSMNAIVRQLQDEGIKIRRQTVARILTKYKECGSLADKTPPGRKPVLSIEQMNFVDAKMEENDELTAIGKYLTIVIMQSNYQTRVTDRLNLQFQDSRNSSTAS